MNCQAGDIAIVVGSHSKFNGHMFEVLYQSPAANFTLPDGYPHESPREHPSWVVRSLESPREHPSWVVRSLAGGVTTACSNGITRHAIYGSCPDRLLRPIRGIPDEEETPRRSEEPA